VCSPNTKYRSIVRHEDQEYVEKSLNLRIPMNLATDSGVNSPRVGAKRRWSFIISPYGYHESSLTHVFS
jgi:hypothetical protein